MEPVVLGIFSLSLMFFLYRYNGYTKTRPKVSIMPSVKSSEDVESGIKQIREEIDRLDRRAQKEEKKISRVKKKLDEYDNE